MLGYIRNLYHPIDRPSRFLVSFPAKDNVSFQRVQKLQWSHRAFVQSSDTFKKNGFVLFDTLTYSDRALRFYHDYDPNMLYQYWDYPCFSRHDVQCFFKLLRKQLTIRGYDVAGGLKYFLTSEYGTDPNHTKRPHYHLLLFVTFEIDPLLLSRLVAFCWRFGRTDGMPYKSRSYVLSERVFRASDSHCVGVLNYVAKYVTKDLYSFKKQYNRCYQCYNIVYKNWKNSYSQRQSFRKFCSNVLPFHLQSLGFGASAIYDVDSFQRGYFIIPSKDIWLAVPISNYFVRKKYMFSFYDNGQLRYAKKTDSESVAFFSKRFDIAIRRYALSLQIYSGMDYDRCVEIAKYRYIWRGLLVPRRFLSLCHDDMLDMVTYPLFMLSKSSLLDQKLDNVLFKVVSFKDYCRFGVTSSFITNSYLSRYLTFSRSYLANSFYEHTLPNMVGLVPTRPYSSDIASFMVSNPFDLVVVSSMTVDRFAGYDDIIDEYQKSVDNRNNVRLLEATYSAKVAYYHKTATAINRLQTID